MRWSVALWPTRVDGRPRGPGRPGPAAPCHRCPPALLESLVSPRPPRTTYRPVVLRSDSRWVSAVLHPVRSTQYHVVATASTLPLYPPPGLPSLHLGSSPPEDTYWGDVQTLNPCVSPPGGEHLPMDYLTRWCCLATNFCLLARCCIATDSYVRSIYAAGLSSGSA